MIPRALVGVAAIAAGAILYWGLALADALGPAWQIVRQVAARDEPHGASQLSLLGVLVAIVLVGVHALWIRKLLRKSNVAANPTMVLIVSAAASCLVIAVGHPKLLPSLLAGKAWLSYEWFARPLWPSVFSRYNEYGAVLPFGWFMLWHTALQVATLLALVAITNWRQGELEKGHETGPLIHP